MALLQKGHLCLTVFRLPQLLSINHKKGSLKTALLGFRLPLWHVVQIFAVRRFLSQRTVSAISPASKPIGPTCIYARISDAAPCNQTAAGTASYAAIPCANRLPTMPDNTSPLPAVAKPALPVLFTCKKPRADEITVSCPFRMHHAR